MFVPIIKSNSRNTPNWGSLGDLVALYHFDRDHMFTDAAKTAKAGDGDPVYVIADASGNGYDLVQSTLSFRATSKQNHADCGADYLLFDGIDDRYVTIQTDIPRKKETTTLVVCKRHSYGESTATMWFSMIAAGDTAPFGADSFWSIYSEPNNPTMNKDNGGNVDFVSLPVNPYSTDWFSKDVLQCAFTRMRQGTGASDKQAVYQNNMMPSDDIQDQISPLTSLTSKKIYVGYYPGAANINWKCDIMLLAHYNSYLTNEHLNQVIPWLNSQFNLSYPEATV